MSDRPLAITLSAPPGPYRARRALKLRIELKNISGRPLWIIGVVDGSEAGYRYPHWEPLITGPEPLSPEGTPWCGNVAPLLLTDFRQLQPNEVVDPTKAAEGAGWLPLVAFEGFSPPVPGIYRVQLILDTGSQKAEEWLGIVGYQGESAVLQRLSQVPRLRVESNTLTIEVT